jgi:hypothetical protein
VVLLNRNKHARAHTPPVFDDEEAHAEAIRRRLWRPDEGCWYPTVDTPFLWPSVRAENGHMCLPHEEWSAGTLIMGDKNTGKSSILLRQFLNAVQDPRGAVILIDPKRTLALRALALTPFGCGKRVWYLDLSRPAFGMSPLRIGASKQAIANVVVAALRDVFPEQLFQASREVIEKCVLAALALAESDGRPPRIEDVFNLMVWENQPLRDRAVAACSRIPNGDRVRDYLTIELAGDMRENTAHTRDRLRAPRNKLDALLQAESLRIFFNHTTEKPLEQIVKDRDVLIVDANLGAGGEENSELMIAFILHMLDSVLKRQQGLDEHDISKVHLFLDEAGHVLNPHILRMQDSHREAGFTLTAAMHYMAQLDPSVLSGILNMLANKVIFRVGSHRDASELRDNLRAAVYSSLNDPDEERLWPEVLQELADRRCIASWMHKGKPLDPFIGSPYPMPSVSTPSWRPQWLEWLAEQVGEYPEHLLWTMRDEQQVETLVAATGATETAAAENGAAQPGVAEDQRPANGHTTQVARLSTAAELAAAAKLPASPTRLEVCSFTSLGIDPEDLDVQAPRAISELHWIEQIKYRTAEPVEDEQNEPLPRLNDRDLSALAALDRLGFLTVEQLGRSSWPDVSVKGVQQNLRKLARAGLVHRYPVQLEGQRGGRSTYLFGLSAKGLHVAQHPPKGRRPSVDERRQHRPSQAVEGSALRHDLAAASWLISFLRAFPTATSQNWRTPRYHSGHLDLPTVAAGRRAERRPMTILEAEQALEEHYCFADVHAPQKIVPDLSIELRLKHNDRIVTTDLLVEIDNTGKPEHNAAKFRNYDSLLCGWSLAVSRYAKLATRPFCLFVCPDVNAMRVLMRRADSEMTGAVGIKGTADPGRWYYAGRDHTAFTTIDLIHYGLPTTWMLPAHPPAVRKQLGNVDGYRVTPVSLLDPALTATEAMTGWKLRAGQSIPVERPGVDGIEIGET